MFTLTLYQLSDFKQEMYPLGVSTLSLSYRNNTESHKDGRCQKSNTSNIHGSNVNVH